MIVIVYIDYSIIKYIIQSLKGNSKLVNRLVMALSDLEYTKVKVCMQVDIL